MSSNAPAVWSAIAASFSALSSFIIMLIHRRNLIEQARPELIITGWERAGLRVDGTEILKFKTVRNVGRGAALDLVIQGKNPHVTPTHHFVSMKRLPILATNEAEDIDGEIFIRWNHIQADHKTENVSIFLRCWDARGTMYETEYSLAVSDLAVASHLINDTILPGVVLTRRATSTPSKKSKKHKMRYIHFFDND